MTHPISSPEMMKQTSFSDVERSTKQVDTAGNTDDVFHCVAACKAVKNGGRPDDVRWWMNRKEDTDFVRNRLGLYRKKRTDAEMVANMNADKAVNEVGLSCPTNKTCLQQCEPYVKALPPKSEDVMRNYMKSPAFRKY